MPAQQAHYFLLTIPQHEFTPFKPDGVGYIKGQLEVGRGVSSYVHWQVMVYFTKKVTCAKVKQVFGDSTHIEISRSAAADEYVWKEDTRVEGTQFQLGRRPMKRNDPKDWDSVLESVKKGRFDEVPADILIRSYGNLKKIHVDSLSPLPSEKEIFVFWGTTGTGKSRKAWEDATWDAYPKDPNTKFWDGYRGQENIVIDEFRGLISISHMLRWLDRYPTIVEIKGSSCVFKGKRIWITSNLSPDEWYPNLDEETRSALRRRFTQVVHFS